MRNALSYVAKTQQSMVAAALRQAFIQPDCQIASNCDPFSRPISTPFSLD
jgi:hypothetical protein